MKKHYFALLTLFAWLLAPIAARADTAYLPYVSSAPQAVATEIGLVVDVIDGDTLDVMLDTGQVVRVRPLCWDAPEISFGIDCYGPEATAHLTALVLGRTVILTRDVSDLGPFDRLLRHVYLVDGTWIGAEMVLAGMARVKEYPPDTRLCPTLWQCQAMAESTGAGGWSACDVWPDW